MKAPIKVYYAAFSSIGSVMVYLRPQKEPIQCYEGLLLGLEKGGNREWG
jgi:hypothetical protein